VSIASHIKGMKSEVDVFHLKGIDTVLELVEDVVRYSASVAISCYIIVKNFYHFFVLHYFVTFPVE